MNENEGMWVILIIVGRKTCSTTRRRNKQSLKPPTRGTDSGGTLEGTGGLYIAVKDVCCKRVAKEMDTWREFQLTWCPAKHLTSKFKTMNQLSTIYHLWRYTRWRIQNINEVVRLQSSLYFLIQCFQSPNVAGNTVVCVVAWVVDGPSFATELEVKWPM